MNIPIRFPNDADVIAADAARFRALSPEDQVRALGECFETYMLLRELSGDPERIDRYAEEEERLGWIAIQEFAARHAAQDETHPV